MNYSTVCAIPYDMYVSGYGSEGVSVLRLWSAKAPNFDMASFNKGDYEKALAGNSVAPTTTIWRASPCVCGSSTSCALHPWGISSTTT